MRLSSKIFHSCLIFTYIQANEGEKEDKCIPSASACPSGWERMEDQCYLWPGSTNSTGSKSSTRKSWAHAELFCKDQDGHLASVTNQRIHDYMKTKVNADDFDAFFWVGGADREQEGNWSWTDGSAWQFTRWATWPRKQPDDWEGEDCLFIHDRGQENGWNDQECSDELRFVCSRPICPDAEDMVSSQMLVNRC